MRAVVADLQSEINAKFVMDYKSPPTAVYRILCWGAA